LIAENISMTGRFLGTAFSGLLVFVLAGCSGPVGLYHSIEGGAIAQKRQAPPGADQPYPNLANVPPAQAPASPSAAARIAQRVQRSAPGVSPASPEALAGLALPTAPPPNPNVPGLHLPAIASTPAIPKPVKAAPAPPPPNGVPVALAFPAGSAILPFKDATALHNFALARGPAQILVGGFGDNVSLTLALARARRLSDALTANGVPPAVIRISAMEAGSGGFVQLVY
jgi:hypothetical protein